MNTNLKPITTASLWAAPVASVVVPFAGYVAAADQMRGLSAATPAHAQGSPPRGRTR